MAYGSLPSLGGNPLLGSGTVDSTTIQAMFPALMPALASVISQTTQSTQTQKTPFEEHKQYMKELATEVRDGIEGNQEYRQIKAAMLEELLMWIVGATTLGVEYTSGPGSKYVEALNKKARELEPNVKTAKDQEVSTLKQQVELLTQELQRSRESQKETEELRNKLEILYSRFGDTANANSQPEVQNRPVTTT